MDAERDDDLDLIRPRMLWYGSVGFMVVGALLAGGTLAACAFAFGDESPTATWVLGSLAVAAPFTLIVVSARRAGAAGRGRGVIRVCGPVLIVAGSLLLAVALGDARARTRRGRSPEIPAIVI